MMQWTGKIAVLLIVGWVATSFGQRKPDAAPVVNQGDVVPDVALFKQAYEKAGEPRLLVICGVDSRRAELALAGIRYNITQTKVTATRNATVVTIDRPKADAAVDEAKKLVKRPQAATGDAQSSGYIGQHVSLFDPTGVSAKLQNDIEQELLANKDLELVNTSALAEVDRREIQLLAQRDQHRAITLLGNKVNADLVLSIRMLPIPVHIQKQHAARYRVTVDILQPTRGRKIGGFAFDWRLATGSEEISAYGEQISRKFIEQLADWYLRGDVPAQKYNVRLVGAKDIGQVVAAKRAFGKIKDMGKIRDRGFSADGKTSVATLEMRYPGSSLDLVYELQQAAAGVLPMKIDTADASTGTLTLILTPGQVPAPKAARPAATATAASEVPFWDKNSPLGQTARQQILQAYQKAQSPKMAILAKVSDPLSGHLQQRLTALGLSVVSPAAVQKLAGEALAAKGQGDDQKRLAIVAKATQAGLVIHLSGSVELNRYSLRLVRAEDGLTLGAESFGGGAMAAASCDHALASILDQAAGLWSPPSQLRLQVAGAGSQRQVLAMMTLLQQQVPGVEAAEFDRFEKNEKGEAVGHIRLTHRGEADDLIKKIESRGQKLSYRPVDSDANLWTMKIKVQ